MLKSTPMVSKPDNFCAFNGLASAPYPITRQQAASGLLSMREAVRRGNGRLVRQGSGKYTLSGLDTVLLSTRYKPTRTGTRCPPGPVLVHNMERAHAR